MHIKDLLLESASPILYHATSLENALSILKQKQFVLTDALHDKTERKSIPKEGWKYYLSTARHSAAVYATEWLDGSEGKVLFKLDGTWFNRKGYLVRPINWHLDDPGYDFSDYKTEAEDRVFSRTPNISIEPITECHVYIEDYDLDWSDVKKLEKWCNSFDIPIYVYEKEQHWFTPTKRSKITPNQFDIKSAKKRQRDEQLARKNLLISLRKDPENIKNTDYKNKDLLRQAFRTNPEIILHLPVQPPIWMYKSYIEEFGSAWDVIELIKKWPELIPDAKEIYGKDYDNMIGRHL